MESLAKALAINHYNLSISTKNTDDPKFDTSEIKRDRLDIIFKKDKNIGDKDIGFSRNILIVGAGASKNACRQAYTTDQIVAQLYKKLSVFTMISGRKDSYFCLKDKTVKEILNDNEKTKPLAEKFFSDAFKHIHRTQDDSMTFETLLKKIGFEGALKILHEFINKEDITRSIVELLNYRYIPNLFYEIIAHMFNHRFIDIIINLNFDEMLDSAIEDEMGDSDWMKITNDASCIKFEKAIVDNRLRIPLYIKPHGTISDIDSMLYSVPQYLNLSSSIRDLLKKIFDGKVSHDNESSNKKIKRFNIISTGYAFNDTDIFGFVCKNIQDNYLGNDEEKLVTNLYIFNPNPIKVLQGISKKIEYIDDEKNNFFKDEVKSYLQNETLMKIIPKENEDFTEDKQIECQKIINSIREKKVKNEGENKTVLKLFILNKENQSQRNLNIKFLKLYNNIRGHFKSPFEPALPLRHLFICKIFTQEYIREILGKDITSKNLEKLLEHRYKVNLLFDILKFNGEVPINVITHGRTGKYYRLYSEKFLENESNNNKPEYIIELLKNEFKSEKFEFGEEFLKSEKIYQSFYGKNTKRNARNREVFFNKLARAIKKINKEYKGEMIDDIFPDLIYKKVPYTGSHEINPKYHDPECVKFYPFKSENIINTNLSLTWYFYDFAINKLGEWDKLIMLTYSGSALINLHKHSDDDCNLKKIFEAGKQIDLYYTCEEPVYFKKIDTENTTPKKITDKIIKLEKKITNKSELFSYVKMNESQNFHKMVLFLEEEFVGEIKREKVKYGIYFFNPPNKNRINPVWFSVDEDDDKITFHKQNLEIMKGYVDTLKKKVKDEKN